MGLLPEVQKHYGKLKFFINGQWVDSKSDLMYKDVNPATGEVIAEFPSATDDEIEAAIQSAQAAFSSWHEIPLRDKARYLFDLRGKFDPVEASGCFQPERFVVLNGFGIDRLVLFIVEMGLFSEKCGYVVCVAHLMTFLASIGCGYFIRRIIAINCS